MGKLRSNRVKRTPQTGITSDRYTYLGLNQAEPNLGDPKVGPSSVGANPIPVGQVYQTVSVDSTLGGRYWTPLVGFGTTVGVISVYENGVLPGGNNLFQKIHGLNFVGTGVTILTPPVAGPFEGVGIATIRFQVNEIKNQGDVGQVLYNGPSGLANGATDLVYYSSNVGIGSTLPGYKLDVLGGTRLKGVLNAGGSDGVSGQYLSATGTGITWSNFPTLRTGFTTTATAGQTGFTTSYNPGFIDVYLNGVRLNEADYTATNGTSITLDTACFGGEVIDILSYNTLSSGSGGGGGGGGPTYITGESYWAQNNSGIHTLSNVGVGTTNPVTSLQVNTFGVSTGVGTFSASPGVSTDIDTFNVTITNFKTAEYTLHIENGSNIQSQKVLVMQNKTTAYSQEYAVMYNPNLLVSVGATISGSSCKLQVTPESGISGLTTYRYTRHTIL